MSLQISTKQFKDSFELPMYGLGTWQMGGGMRADITNDQAEAKAIRAAINWQLEPTDRHNLTVSYSASFASGRRQRHNRDRS